MGKKTTRYARSRGLTRLLPEERRLATLATERRDLLNFDPATSAPWPILDTPGQEVQPIALYLNAEVRVDMRWTHWVQAFMDVHETLTRKVRMTAGVVA